MTHYLLARVERAAQSWSYRRGAVARAAGAYFASVLAVLAVDGVAALAIGYSLWRVLRMRG